MERTTANNQQLEKVSKNIALLVKLVTVLVTIMGAAICQRIAYLNNSLHLADLARKKPGLFREANCELRETDNVQGQISEHVFTPN